MIVILDSHEGTEYAVLETDGDTDEITNVGDLLNALVTVPQDHGLLIRHKGEFYPYCEMYFQELARDRIRFYLAGDGLE